MKFGVCLFLIGASLQLPVITEASNKSKLICTTGPFTFEGKDVWNTQGTLWAIDKQTFPLWTNHYMSLSFSNEIHKAAASGVSSPNLCSADNWVHDLSFRFSIAGLPSDTLCALEVFLLEDDREFSLWRSSGGTSNLFKKISPPIRFYTCSPNFKLTFTGTKVTSGKCGLFFNNISFDNVKYAAVDISGNFSHLCPARPKPTPKPSRRGLGWSMIAIIASLAFVVIIVIVLALLLIVTVSGKRKTRALVVNRGKKVQYHTFPSDAPECKPEYEYEPVEGGEPGDGLTTDAMPSSSQSDNVYDRLRRTGGRPALGPGIVHKPYSHCSVTADEDTAYNDLQQQNKFRDLQRQIAAKTYSHM